MRQPTNRTRVKTILLLSLLSTSCATYQNLPSNREDNFFVFREGYAGSATRMQVFVDGKLMGKMFGYRYLSFSLTPGLHEVYFKFSPIVGRSAKRSFTIIPEEKKVFIVKKTLLSYGVKVSEEKIYPWTLSKNRNLKFALNSSF